MTLLRSLLRPSRPISSHLADDDDVRILEPLLVGAAPTETWALVAAC